MRTFTAAEKRREMERELGYRLYVYAQMVTKGKMTQVESDRRIAIVEAIIQDYRAQGEREEPQFKFPDSY